MLIALVNYRSQLIESNSKMKLMKTLKIITFSLILPLLLYSCNKNEFAPEIVDQEFTLDENSPAGTIIGKVQATDQDDGQILAFEIIDGNDEGICEIQSNGSLEVSDPSNLDFESITQLILTISVSDGHKKEPFESAAKVRINIQDVNEFAPEIASQEYIIDENPNNGQEIGLLVASDQESHQILTYQILESDDSEYISIDSITGMLSVLDSAGFDYESNQILTVKVSVRDDHENSLSATADISIHLNDLLEEKHLELTLRPDAASGKDAVVSAIVPDNNYGTLEELLLYAWTQDGILNVSRSIIDFDLASIPTDARIDSAFLSLYFNPGSAYASQHSGETNFTIQRLVSEWDESTVTWSSQPAPTYTNIVYMDRASSPFQDFPGMEITALIQDYTSDPVNSHGLVLKFVDEAPYKNLILSSSDHPIEYFRPKLEVYYTILE